MSTAEDHIEVLEQLSVLPKRFGKTQPQQTPTPEAKASSRDVLIELALQKAMDDELRARLVDGTIRAAVIDVPDGTWSDPMGDAIEALLGDTAYVLSRSRTPKPRDLDDGMMIVRLRDGRAVVGIAPHSAQALPPLLLSVSELTVTIAPPDSELVLELVRRCQPEALPDEIGQLEPGLLSFDEIASIIDGRTPAARTIERLRSAIARKVGVVAPRSATKALPRLEDAIEYGEARDWAMSLRDDIADYRKGAISGSDLDKGCVLHGPPGTGKTLLAEMLGEACGVPVVISSLGEMFAQTQGYLNEMIKQLRDLFDDAKAKAPCILFLDEINALPNIDRLSERNRDYWVPLILDFYQLLDGATSDRDGVIVIGATNRLQDIHPALLRPGRLERSIYVGPPNAEGMERIMRHHLGDDLEGADLAVLATLNAARGATGAVAMEQVRAARRLARRAGRPMVIEDLQAQIIGREHRTEDQLRRSAVHEAGHIIAGRSVGAKVDTVSIIAHGDSGGSARVSIPIDKLVMRSQFEGLVVSLLGGRAAEQLILGEASQGAGGSETSDLAKASAIVASMDASLGLGDSLLHRSAPEDAVGLLRDPEFRRRADKTIRDLYQRTIDILHEHRPALNALTEALLATRFLTGAEVEAIITDVESTREKSGCESQVEVDGQSSAPRTEPTPDENSVASLQHFTISPPPKSPAEIALSH